MGDDMYDYMDEMLGEKLRVGDVFGQADSNRPKSGDGSKSSIHPLWKLIDTWGGTLSLKARQLTLWGVESE